MQLKKICAVIFLILSSMSCKHGNSDVSISSSSSEDIEESSSEYIDLERDYSYNNGSLFKIKNITLIENNQIIIPSSINGETIKRIGKDALSYFKYRIDKLITLVIPDSITEICDNAFRDCYFIEKVIFSPNSKLEKINPGVFSSCKNLKEISFPSTLKKIEDNSFLECKSLTKITLPKSIVYVSKFAFYKCENMEGFYIDGESEFIEAIDGVIYSKNLKELRVYPYGKKDKAYKVLPKTRSISMNAFYSNLYIEEINLCNVEVIYNNSFFNCNNLKTIHGSSLWLCLNGKPFLETKWYKEQKDFAKIGKCLISYKGEEKIINQTHLSDIKYISGRAFDNTLVEEITIPSNVKYIMPDAFINNRHLKKVIILGNAIAYSSSFKGNNPNLNVYMPSSLYNTYIEDPDYKEIDYSFSKIITNASLNINGKIVNETLSYGDEYDFSSYLDNNNTCFVDENNKYYPIKGTWNNINENLTLNLVNDGNVKFVDKNNNLLLDYKLQNGDSFSINNNDILINNKNVYTLPNSQKYYEYTFKIDESTFTSNIYNNDFMYIQVEEIPIEYMVSIYKYRIGADNEVEIIPFTCRDIANRGLNHFLPPADPKDEYDFEGLYFDENYTNKLDNDNLNLLIDNKIEHLYAKWVKIENA